MKKLILKSSLASLMTLTTGCTTYHKLPTDHLRTVTAHQASINKGQIEYYEFGSGSPIILIPGYATDVTSWNKDFLAALARNHRIIVLNNRNVGASYVASSTYSSEDLANDINQVIKKLKLVKPTILGISMGGMIAQQFAISHPDSMSSLVLINTAMAGKEATRPSSVVEAKLRIFAKNKVGFYISAIDLFFPAAWKVKMAASLATDRFQPANYTEFDFGKVLYQQQTLIQDWFDNNEAGEKIKHLRMPTLVLNGKADSVIPPANSLMLSERIPNAKLVTWQDGGHAMIYQYPVEMANVINQFISDA